MKRIPPLAVLALGVVLTGVHNGSGISHSISGIAVTLLCAVTCFMARGSARVVAIVALAAGVVACARIGGVAVHAVMGEVFFAGVLAMAFGQITEPCPPALRKMTVAAPALLSIQIVLGAGYRHKLLGVLPHMAGAMLVAGWILVVAVMILQVSPRGVFRNAAVALMVAVLTQVSLGIAAFVMRLLDFDNGIAFAAVSTAHVCVGAMTLAASVVVALVTCGEARSTQSSGPST